MGPWPWRKQHKNLDNKLLLLLLGSESPMATTVILFLAASLSSVPPTQVTKRGEFVDIHNHPILVTMGIAASKPSMPLPDLMIIARDKRGRKDPKSKELEVTR